MPSIARAWIGKPKVILLDKPSEGIMPVLADEMLALFANLKAKDLTILLVEQSVQPAFMNQCWIAPMGDY